MSPLRVLLTVIATVLGDDPRVTAFRDPLVELLGRNHDALEKAMHQVADDYATRAWEYLHEHPGGRDQSLSVPAMVLVGATHHAVTELDRLGYPILSHEVQHSVWAASRAALAALVWAQITLGHIEADHRIRKTRQRLAQAQE